MGQEHLREILAILKRTYPDTRIALHFRNPYELLVATILSAQCTDEVVNRVTPALFKQFPSPEILAQAESAEVEKLIHATGFFRNKAKNIIGMAKTLTTEFAGTVPQTMGQLLRLPGVARKTANVVMAAAFGLAEGVVVDTHVRRIVQRLGWTTAENPVKIEQDLMRMLPQAEWKNFAIRIIFHGRRICRARKPDCPDCPLMKFCPSAGKLG